jgi:hypothetical protein
MGMMEGTEWTIAPRRRIMPGEEDAARAAFVDAAWHDPQRARAEALEARLRYWRQREAALTELIQQTQIAGKRAKTRYSDELGPLYADLDTVRAELRALEGELASIGVTLASPASHRTGSAGRPRRKRRRVTGGLPRRRRVAAAAG